MFHSILLMPTIFDSLSILKVLIFEVLDEFGWFTRDVHFVNMREIDHLAHTLNQAITKRLLRQIKLSLILVKLFHFLALLNLSLMFYLV